MRSLVETARAKVNLTLGILGRRDDGYHELASLVAFAADAADTITLDLLQAPGVVLEGPFAPTLAGENLVATAVAKALAVEPRLTSGRITLDKRLPVAAGIGGGSADAAAVLRLLQRANPELAAGVDWLALATSLGADVPVCLDGRAAFMTGIGERLAPLPRLPALDAVLINPLLPVPPDKTAQVFRRLGAPPLSRVHVAAAPPAGFDGRDDVLAYIADHPNDLEPAARAVVPAIDQVMAALAATEGCRMARLSGGGPTCFGLYGTAREAQAAAASLSARHPSWWAVATTLS